MPYEAKSIKNLSETKHLEQPEAYAIGLQGLVVHILTSLETLIMINLSTHHYISIYIYIGQKIRKGITEPI